MAPVLGRPLKRSGALSHPLKAELFAICDRILTDDQRVGTFLGG
jgi:hypothetical protein